MIGTTFIQPIDMIKVQIQCKSETKSGNLSPLSIAKEIYTKEGIKSFYKGIDSALLRQAIYTSLRLGLYFNFFDYIKKIKKANLTLTEKSFCSLVAGAISSFVATPCDVALIRMQSDTILPVEQRRNYKNVFDAFSRMIKEEGLSKCWKGASPTVLRAMASTLG